MRPPYDAMDSTVLDQIGSRGLTTMSYSIDPRDWTVPGVSAIVDNVVGAAFPGAVVDMHDGGGDRSETVAALPAIITGLEARGYSFVSICGAYSPPLPPQTSAVYGFGAATASTTAVTSAVPFSGMDADPASGGYWMTAQDGGVFSFGGAGFYGSLPGIGVTPARPVVGIASTPDGRGYWQVASDGGVFTFGDAGFYGSMGAQPPGPPGGRHRRHARREGLLGGGLRRRGVRLRRRRLLRLDGRWHLDQPDRGDGGLRRRQGLLAGGLRRRGLLLRRRPVPRLPGGQPLVDPVVGWPRDPATGGYWMVAADGGVFSFGAPFYGSRGGTGGTDRFFAVSATDGGRGYLLAGQHDATGS